jgi:hypothetical protein
MHQDRRLGVLSLRYEPLGSQHELARFSLYGSICIAIMICVRAQKREMPVCSDDQHQPRYSYDPGQRMILVVNRKNIMA